MLIPSLPLVTGMIHSSRASVVFAGSRGCLSLFLMVVVRRALLCFCFIGICIFLFCAEADKGTGDSKKHSPVAGWCLTKHRPLRAAQSGHGGYCKSCYQERFPKKYAEKQRLRKKSCKYCQEERETDADGARGLAQNYFSVRFAAVVLILSLPFVTGMIHSRLFL